MHNTSVPILHLLLTLQASQPSWSVVRELTVTTSFNFPNLMQARERRQELQKMRALMSYREQKCRRVKKIKSKR